MSIEDGREWWAFQPVRETTLPKVKTAGWAADRIDTFILEGLEKKGLKPSPREDARSLVRRGCFHLGGDQPPHDEGGGGGQRQHPQSGGEAIGPPPAGAAQWGQRGAALEGG